MPIKHDGQDVTFRPPVGSFRSLFYVYFFLSGYSRSQRQSQAKKSS